MVFPQPLVIVQNSLSTSSQPLMAPVAQYSRRQWTGTQHLAMFLVSIELDKILNKTFLSNETIFTKWTQCILSNIWPHGLPADLSAISRIRSWLYHVHRWNTWVLPQKKIYIADDKWHKSQLYQGQIAISEQQMAYTVCALKGLGGLDHWYKATGGKK